MQTPKVLLVNDDQASLYALESLLLDAADQHVYELISAASGKEALRHVLRHEFAVILLDVSMPGMDGFETAEAIHSHPRSAGTPIIFITAHYADELNRLKAYQKGAADYLFTPVIPQILQAKVAVFVEMAKKNMLLRIQAEELARLNQDLRVQRLQDLERINAELEQEVKERKAAEQRAHELSTRDALTNLLNRRALIQQLEHAVATSDRSGIGFALLFLDLDKFKPINDTYGHEAGDELLRQVAARLTAAVRVADIVARLGGDEFVVLIEGKSASANAARVGRKIETACALPFEIGGQRVKTAASIGIALYPQDGANAQALMKNADTAMYHAKQNSATPVQFFHEELNVRERERERWTLELRKALASGQLELRYEPQIDLDTGRMIAAEALLYWRHPAHGAMEAAQFLPLVQERALLDRIDAWVVAQCCSQAALWQGLHGSMRNVPAPAAARQLCIWLNLATPQLHSDLLQALLPAMRKHGLAPGSIGVELNEKLLIGASEPLAHLLAQMQEAGVHIALDDFGSARSSLAACKRWQLNTLKIDRSFVHGIGNDEGGTDIVAAVIHLARALSMQVVALGVETRQQLEVLQAQGCHTCQGALFYPPLPAAGLLEQASIDFNTHHTLQSNEDISHE
ncbi:diguanylate cyclase (GGDEF) domain-containing protein [Duganella sp. CF402]|uniref:putative bifunctional diguanylate cyclase/phosphodiesterase n=1 Tax=unclassified Duganella TaxID=2636909 RepID=UPI0008D8899E|nr:MULTISPECIES: EAL domain-containing protein [unclassified Duganella]RZT09958.1 diguanylate cyclase (GGDEF)-like protein [Duganella sp. BK701]SEL35284.1 diguanylate cyclase (GGDEF) domain-containing protein [Duganella sp. CF402]